MASTNDLVTHPRLSWEPREDGSTVARFDMQGWGNDILCRYWPEECSKNRDPWSYSLESIEGKGGTYSHVSEHGCRIAIVRHLIDAGLIGALEDNSHLDERNAEIAAKLAARHEDAANGRPRVGDFVIMPGGTEQRCSHAWPDGMQTSQGGSFCIHGGIEASFSGGLNRDRLWEYFKPTGETRPGRFWFFSHNIVGAGRAVDVYLPCRVFRLEPFGMSEAEARAHPKAQASAKCWGENHAEHLRTIEKLMAGAA